MAGLQITCTQKPVDTTIDSGAQVQQVINIECITEFAEAPILAISFTCNGNSQRLKLKLPVMCSKFSEPVEMDSGTFFSRWKALSQPNQECQKVFKAKFPIDTEQNKTKILGFGVSVLEGIDPNPENYVAAGIIHARSAQIGCLIRLEPNKAAQMYRLTIRASKPPVPNILADLLEHQF
ncbi:AP-2 complex subunit alpha-2-like [Saccostrea cucullata]|uniref:AP-2 complex subunit alpha-2-like n=1 Tax=Saccostrea cuccullata TaxID=36930 RepID=UPI002ED68C9C